VLPSLINIILKRKGAADVPFSTQAMLVLGALNAAYYLVTLNFAGIGLTISHIFAGLALVIVPALAVDRVLKSAGKAPRFTQTMTAYFGVSMLLGLLQMTVTLLLQGNGLAMLLNIAITVYTLIVLGAILSEASGLTRGKSIFIVFMVSMVAGTIAIFLTPEKMLLAQQIIEQSAQQQP
jgi:hypothetical protein